jgi:hypothetical protein
LENGSKSAATEAAQRKAGAGAPTSLRDPAAPRFWTAVALTGLGAGFGAALLTLIFKAVQSLAWGTSEPSALLEAARNASPLRHVALLLAAGLVTAGGQWLLTRLTSGNGIDITAAILV